MMVVVIMLETYDSLWYIGEMNMGKLFSTKAA